MPSENSTLTTDATTTNSVESASVTSQSTETSTDSADQAQTETASTDAADGEGSSEESNAEKQPEGAPDAYSFAEPEGTQLDPKTIEQFSEVAKELNLTQEAAQKLIDKMGPAMAQRQAEAVQAIHEQWAGESKADKEFGGDALQENLGVAKKALDMLGTPKLRDLLNESGLGNHPEMIRLLVRAGKAISEDSVVTGGVAVTRDARSFYTNSDMK